MRAPQHITVRLGDDFNWWVESTHETEPTPQARGVLDPRQLTHLAETLDAYREYGYRPQQLAAAFHAYRVEAEISEGILRLVAVEDDIFDATTELFALPVLDADNREPYADFLDAISAARVRKLNATHHYARNCTEDDLTGELEMIDANRYFSADTMHVFDEIAEILEWHPAEWDEP